MIVAIHRDSQGETSYAAKWAEYLDQAGVDVKFVNLHALDALNQVKDCNGVMWHWEYLPLERQSAPTILRAIENYLGIPVFPDQRTCWHYDDKIAQWYLFQTLKVKTPKTWVFWDREAANEWAREASYPVVFKLKTGSSASNVHLVESLPQALRVIELMFGPGTFARGFNQPTTALEHLFERNAGTLREAARRARRRVRGAMEGMLRPDPRAWWIVEKDYVYFQEFVPGNDGDTRITVIGHRAYGIYRRNRPGDFRASGSKLLDYDRSRISLACVKLAHELSAALGAQSMAYDFLLNENGEPLLGEMSYIYLDWPIEKCDGYWDPNLNWIPGRAWPQAAHVEDFLARIREV
jgi:hypothetical protein